MEGAQARGIEGRGGGGGSKIKEKPHATQEDSGGGEVVEERLAGNQYPDMALPV